MIYIDSDLLNLQDELRKNSGKLLTSLLTGHPDMSFGELKNS